MENNSCKKSNSAFILHYRMFCKLIRSKTGSFGCVEGSVAPRDASTTASDA